MSDEISDRRSTDFQSLKEVAVANQDYELAAFLRELGLRHENKSYPMLRELVHRLSEAERVPPNGKLRVPIMTTEYQEVSIAADYVLECEVSDISATYTEFVEGSEEGVEHEGAGSKYLEAARVCAHAVKHLTSKLLRAEATIKQLVANPPVPPPTEQATGLQVPTIDLKLNDLFTIAEQHLPTGWAISLRLRPDQCILLFFGPQSDRGIVFADEASLNLSERITSRINHARKEAGLPPTQFPVAMTPVNIIVPSVAGAYTSVGITTHPDAPAGILCLMLQVTQDSENKTAILHLRQVVAPSAVIDAFLSHFKEKPVDLYVKTTVGQIMCFTGCRISVCGTMVASEHHSIMTFMEIITKTALE